MLGLLPLEVFPFFLANLLLRPADPSLFPTVHGSNVLPTVAGFFSFCSCQRRSWYHSPMFFFQTPRWPLFQTVLFFLCSRARPLTTEGILQLFRVGLSGAPPSFASVLCQPFFNFRLSTVSRLISTRPTSLAAVFPVHFRPTSRFFFRAGSFPRRRTTFHCKVFILRSLSRPPINRRLLSQPRDGFLPPLFSAPWPKLFSFP